MSNTYFLMSGAAVDEMTDTGKSARYERMDPNSENYDPDFPLPIILSKRCVRWRSDEILAWMDKKSTNRDLGREARSTLAKQAASAKKKHQTLKSSEFNHKTGGSDHG